MGSFKWGVGNGELNLQEKTWACALSQEPPEPLAFMAKGLAVPCTKTARHVLVLRCATAQDWRFSGSCSAFESPFQES